MNQTLPSSLEPSDQKEMAEQTGSGSGESRGRPEEPALVSIPAGNFWMGIDPAQPELMKLKSLELIQAETPAHQLYLPEYAIGRYPVTNAEYARFIEAGGYDRPELWTAAGWRQKERFGWLEPEVWSEEERSLTDYPVVGVSWYEGVAYCRWLSRVTNRLYRLATEAEWEKAARGSQGNIWPWGDGWVSDRCNNPETGPGRPTPVSRYSPAGDSPYGAADMIGNIWEWCVTKFGKSYPYDNEEDEWTADYLEGDAVRMLRGASRLFRGSFARSTRRDQNLPAYRDDLVGFRVVTVDG